MADRIKVRTEWLDGCASDLSAVESAIRSAQSTLSGIQLSRSEGGNLNVRLNLSLGLTHSRFTGSNAHDDIQALSRAAQALSARVGQLSSGADKASQIFQETENYAVRLMGGNPTGINTEVYEDGNSVASIDWNQGGWKIIDDILDWLNIGRYDRNYVNPGKEAELAHDALMQEQIEQLMQDPKYNESAWGRASIEGKKKIFNEVKEELNRIYGTNISKDVDYFPGEPYTNPKDGLTYIKNGYYSDDSRSIHMSTYNLKNRTFEQNMTTLVHEMRHAYQHEVARHPDKYTISEDTARSWEYNINHYKTIEKDGFQAYRSQPIEQDARDFSENIDYE